MVRRSTGRCVAADSWYTTGWESRGSGASQCSGHFQSVWPRCAELWCPLVGPGGQPLCILLLSGTGNRHRYSAVRQGGPSTEHHRVMWAATVRGRSTSMTDCWEWMCYDNKGVLYLSSSGKCVHHRHIESLARQMSQRQAGHTQNLTVSHLHSHLY